MCVCVSFTCLVARALGPSPCASGSSPFSIQAVFILCVAEWYSVRCVHCLATQLTGLKIIFTGPGGEIEAWGDLWPQIKTTRFDE